MTHGGRYIFFAKFVADHIFLQNLDKINKKTPQASLWVVLSP
jgi:hypothetical protein